MWMEVVAVWERLKRVWRDERGASEAIAAAILYPLLIGLALGVLQWGINLSTVGALEQGVREGARYAAITGDYAGARDQVERILLNSSLAVNPAKFDKNRDVTITSSNGYLTLAAIYRQPNFVPGLPKLFGLNQADPDTWTFTASPTFRQEQ